MMFASKLREGVALAPLTTIGVGGAARYFLRVTCREDAVAALRWARERALPLLVLGGGSNLLVADEGFSGLVLHMALPGVQVRRERDAVEITAGAGERWERLVARAVAHGWAGVECLAGIPGLVGATPVQNVGAYGQEVSEVITRVEALDMHTLDTVTFDNADCAFGYRESRFKGAARDRYLILAVSYRLIPHGPPTVHYIELERALAARELPQPTLREVWQVVLDIRRGKSMLLRPHDANARSAGSFFMNPLLGEAEMEALDAAIARRLPGAHIPRFAKPGGGVKIPAAWLIERSGFARGYAAGPVALSENHVLAIVNHGGATAHDVLALARTIRDRVRDLFGITLTTEPVLVGVSLED